MLSGSLRLGRALGGYISGGLIEVHSIVARHGELVEEFGRRGYVHRSPLVGEFFMAGKVDVARSLSDLKARCVECRRRIESAEVEGAVV
jgi:hypothetical protein